MRANHLNATELAQRLGVSTATLSNYLNGKRQPSRETLERLAVLLHTSVSTLLGEPTGAPESICAESQPSYITMKNDLDELEIASLLGLSLDDVIRLKKEARAQGITWREIVAVKLRGQ